MKTAIIYHSHSGITRKVAEELHKEISGELIEVTPEKPYSSLMVYPKGCYRAAKGLSDSIKPARIDLSGFDQVVIASPVWAGKQTPVINGALDALTHGEGKRSYAIMTCGKRESGEEAMKSFTSAMSGAGLSVVGSSVLDKNMVSDSGSIAQVIAAVQSGME